MDKELRNFTENIDAWVKQIRKEFKELEGLPNMVLTNADNINENQNSIFDLKERIEELKRELNALRLIQLLSLRKEKAERLKEETNA